MMTKKECDDAREDALRDAITIINEQKRYESHIYRLQSDVHQANNAVDKMRDEAVRLRSKNNDLKQQLEATARELHHREPTILVRWMVWSGQLPSRKKSGPDFNFIITR
jgi:phage shock protein A